MKRLYHIDFIKFLSAIGLVYFHLLHYNLPATLYSVYQPLANSSAPAYILVELFLIISGYFLYKNTHSAQSISKQIFKLFFRIYPVFLFYNIILYISGNVFPNEVTNNLLLIQCTQIVDTCRTIVWFVSPFFWCTLLIYTILKLFKNFGKYIVFILMVTCYALLLKFSDGNFDKFYTITPYLNFAFVRVMGGLCLGTLVGAISNAQKIPRFLIYISEMICYITLFIHMFVVRIFANDIYCVLLFVILVILNTSYKSLFAHLFNNKTFGILGRYAFCIYIMQQISFNLIQVIHIEKYLSAVPTLILFITLSVIIGIITYYIIELPISRLNHKISKHK